MIAGYVLREPEESVPPYAPKPSLKTHSPHVSVSSASSYPEYEHHVHYEQDNDDDDKEESPHSVARTNSSSTVVERER